jgi:hypothetical protein
MRTPSKNQNYVCPMYSTHTYINVRNKNKIKKSNVRHQIFRISDYKHMQLKFILWAIFSLSNFTNHNKIKVVVK